MVILGNIDTDMDFLENINTNIDIDIDMDFLENIDIDKGTLQNINIDKIYKFSREYKHKSSYIYIFVMNISDTIPNTT